MTPAFRFGVRTLERNHLGDEAQDATAQRVSRDVSQPAARSRLHDPDGIPEFTCLCPKTGQPDFATLLLEYVPDEKCVELKSLKLYIWSYRNEGAFHEAVTNRIADDLAALLGPRFMRLTADFNVRGGIYTTIVAERRQAGWVPPTPTPVPAAAD